MIKCTNLNPDSEDGRLYLHLHFISQSVPDIRKKLQKLENGPQTLQHEPVKLAFKVNREEVLKTQKLKL